MDKNKYHALMQDLADPDKAPAALVQLQTLVDNDHAEYEESQTQLTALNGRIKTLKETNASLALDQVKAPNQSQQQPEELTDDQVYHNLFGSKFQKEGEPNGSN